MHKNEVECNFYEYLLFYLINLVIFVFLYLRFRKPFGITL